MVRDGDRPVPNMPSRARRIVREPILVMKGICFAVACALALSSAALAAGTPPSRLTGILVSGAGEMYLYKEGARTDLLPGDCTTLTARSVDLLKQYRRHAGRRVIVKGRALGWPGGPTIYVGLGGNVVRNLCNSVDVIVIDSISEVGAPR